MILTDKFTLENGLKVIVHQDKTTPVVAFNILYDVGAKDESPNQTGFAHLFEHLMFGGSINIPDFDGPLQDAGGENNAFTNNDFTNYYISLPKNNLEIAFWLESDRMLSLGFTDKSLEVQQSVVIEEFRQRYLNQPYGDIWLLLRPLAYKVHPYMWATIGKEISHIENAKMQDVKDFFYKHYAPNNAILCVAGDVELDEIKQLTQKWFGNIERRNVPIRNLPKEPKQTEPNFLKVERDVPYDSIYKAYHICNRNDPEFYAIDLISDVLSNGQSSRLYQNLVKERNLFSNIDAYHTGHIEEGLLVISGKLIKGISFEEAENAIEIEIERLKNELISDYELEKVKNKLESTHIFSETNVLNKAMDLCYYELLGNSDNLNFESEKYRKIEAEDIRNTAIKLFTKSNCSTLHYVAKPSLESIQL